MKNSKFFTNSKSIENESNDQQFKGFQNFRTPFSVVHRNNCENFEIAPKMSDNRLDSKFETMQPSLTNFRLVSDLGQNYNIQKILPTAGCAPALP